MRTKGKRKTQKQMGGELECTQWKILFEAISFLAEAHTQHHWWQDANCLSSPGRVQHGRKNRDEKADVCDCTEVPEQPGITTPPADPARRTRPVRWRLGESSLGLHLLTDNDVSKRLALKYFKKWAEVRGSSFPLQCISNMVQNSWQHVSVFLTEGTYCWLGKKTDSRGRQWKETTKILLAQRQTWTQTHPKSRAFKVFFP